MSVSLDEAIGQPSSVSVEDRISACQALGCRSRSSAATAVPALLAILLERSGSVIRDSAIRSLGLIGAAAAEAVPELTRVALYEDGFDRPSAAEALGKIGPSKAVPLLITVLINDPNKTTRMAAAEALGYIGSSDPWIISSLMSAVHDLIKEVRISAILALGRIGPGASASVADLIDVLTDRSMVVQFAAIRVLGKIGPSAADAIPALTGFLAETRIMRLEAAEAIRLIQA